MSWTDVVTHPLGIAGFAIAVMLTVAGRITGKRKPAARRLLYGIYGLAALAVITGLVLAITHPTPPIKEGTLDASRPQVAPAPSMHIDKIEQKAPGGSAVAGVQGNVNIQEQPADKQAPDARP